MSDAIAFLIWLVCIGISALLIGYFLRKTHTIPAIKEGFKVHICPSGSTSYITRDGETLCCNGDIVDRRCTGNNVCSLSPKNKYGIIWCTDLAAQNAAATGAAQCPTDIPNYFGSTDGSLRGCSVSQPTSDGTAPSDPTQLQCILYPTLALDKVKLDSCYNYMKNAAAQKAANSSACVSASAAASAKKTAANMKVQAAQAAVDAAVAEANAEAGGSCPVASVASPVGSMASMASVASPMGSMGSVASPVASMALPSAANPTGYVIYGDGISGNLPVTKMIDGFNPGQTVPSAKLYLAQDGTIIRMVELDMNYTRNYGSSYFTGNLSEINSFGDINRISGSAPGGNRQAKYSIKRADGTGILTPQGVPPSTNPNDYIITGGRPQLSPPGLNVTKIVPDIDKTRGTFLNFYAQDYDTNGTPIMRFVTVHETRYILAGSYMGDISTTDFSDSYKLTRNKPPGNYYTLRMKDGSASWGP